MARPRRTDAAAGANAPDPARRHLRFGWWMLLVFLALGLVLEALHGFKVSWYLDVSVQSRRLMWTLAHAHGTLVALIHLAFGLMLRSIPVPTSWVRRASPCLYSGSLLLPAGFFLGGFRIYGGDPNPAVLLVPLGGVVLLVGVGCVAVGVGRTEHDAG